MTPFQERRAEEAFLAQQFAERRARPPRANGDRKTLRPHPGVGCKDGLAVFSSRKCAIMFQFQTNVRQTFIVARSRIARTVG
jgi:hypothetical protein